MKRVVITGATSMLGLALAQRCVAQGTGVLALVRRGSKKAARLPTSPLLRTAECELDGYAGFAAERERAPGGYDAFYHFAWQATTAAQRYDPDAQAQNLGYTLDAVRLAARLGCGRFIGAGSQAEYGRVAGSISEDTPTAPDSAYGVAKYAAGRLSSLLAQQLGIGWVWARIFSTYGPGDMPSTMVMDCIRTLLAGQAPALTACEQQWDYLYCHDAADAFYRLGAAGHSGQVYNIGSGTARPLLWYVNTLRDAIDPALPLGVGQRPYARHQVMHLCANIEKLHRHTGFAPATPFADGIRHTIAWVKEEDAP